MKNWFDLPGYKGLYEVTTTGKVRNKRTGRVIAVQYEGTNMARVRLSRKGEERSMRVVDLVKTAKRIASR